MLSPFPVHRRHMSARRLGSGCAIGRTTQPKPEESGLMRSKGFWWTLSSNGVLESHMAVGVVDPCRGHDVVVYTTCRMMMMQLCTCQTTMQAWRHTIARCEALAAQGTQARQHIISRCKAWHSVQRTQAVEPCIPDARTSQRLRCAAVHQPDAYVMKEHMLRLA